MKKLLLGLGSVAAIAAPIAAVVSCGDDVGKEQVTNIPMNTKYAAGQDSTKLQALINTFNVAKSSTTYDAVMMAISVEGGAVAYAGILSATWALSLEGDVLTTGYSMTIQGQKVTMNTIYTISPYTATSNSVAGAAYTSMDLSDASIPELRAAITSAYLDAKVMKFTRASDTDPASKTEVFIMKDASTSITGKYDATHTGRGATKTDYWNIKEQYSKENHLASVTNNFQIENEKLEEGNLMVFIKIKNDTPDEIEVFRLVKGFAKISPESTAAATPTAHGAATILAEGTALKGSFDYSI